MLISFSWKNHVQFLVFIKFCPQSYDLNSTNKMTLIIFFIILSQERVKDEANKRGLKWNNSLWKKRVRTFIVVLAKVYIVLIYFTLIDVLRHNHTTLLLFRVCMCVYCITFRLLRNWCTLYKSIHTWSIWLLNVNYILGTYVVYIPPPPLSFLFAYSLACSFICLFVENCYLAMNMQCAGERERANERSG